MLRSLKLENFRGFRRHTLPFRQLSIVVGKNNAGKSTIVEALRLISIVTGRYRNLAYKYPPSWIRLPRRNIGVSPSLRGLGVNFASLFYRYGEPPALVTAEFDNGSRVELYIRDEDSVFAIIRNPEGKIIKSKAMAAQHTLPSVGIMPQVTPVAREEVVLNEDYVKRSISSALFSAHFRNQVKIFSELFTQFCGTVETTWPGVRVQELICDSNSPGTPIYLEIRNEDFVAEIAAMGHGLQMWLQTIWFLTRCEAYGTVILDEPDVYMHPDLQRRIIRHLRTKHHQVIIATHSVEILSEVDSEDILVVDRSRPSSGYAESLPAVQVLANDIGTAHNLHLARLWRSNLFILIEGKDLKILKHFQNTLYPQSEAPFDAIPNMSIGGWGGWPYAIGSSLALKNSLGADLKAYCILDSDYHTDEEIDGRRNEARGKDVELHIWAWKEIENYLLCPEAIARVINQRVSRRTSAPAAAEIDAKIDEMAESQRDVIFDGIASSCLAVNRGLGSGGANRMARAILKERQARDGGLRGLVSGKAVLSMLSQWSQDEFGVSFGASKVARAMSAAEIPEEVRNVVRGLELRGDIS